jgi:PncC family amidohydrolase
MAHHSDSQSLEESIQTLFVSQGWTLCTAESCTGGAIAAKLTRNPGASQYFVGGIVAYSNKLKEKLLQVDPQHLTELGAVDEETVRQMAENAMRMMETDFAIATSGIAGPTGGSFKKPVGTVWIAIAKKDCKTYTCLLKAQGNRTQIIEESSRVALEALLKRPLQS